MSGLLRDVRDGARQMIRHPGATLVALVTLAFGVGTTTAVFSVLHGILLAPLPYVGQGLVVRTAIDPARLQESVRGAVLEVNRDQAVRDLRPLEALKATSMASDRLRSLVLTIFAAMALTLAASTIVLSAVAMLACYVPARRAASIDPLQTLRSE